MEYIDFGPNKTKVSKVILGCMRIPSKSFEDVVSLLDVAKDSGINFLDIADCYSNGKAESLLGDALKGKSSYRDSFFIQSKCGINKDDDGITYFDFSKEHIIKSVEGSLKRLRTDRLDCLLLHRPDALMDPAEVGEAFNTLRRDGKVLNFGVSNMNPMQIRLLKSGLDCELCTNQVQMSICHTPMLDSGFNANMTNNASVNHDGSILEYCRLKKMVIQAWSVLQYGFFQGVFVGSPLYLKLNSVLDRIATEQGVTSQAVAIAWVLRYSSLMQAVIGTTNPHRVMACAKACDVQLSRKQWYELYLASGNDLP